MDKVGPSVSSLILKAVAASSDRGGLSLAALEKALKAGGYDVVKNNVRILVAIKCLLTKKSLVQTKGRGASGSFKLNKKPPKPRKKKVVKKKPIAKKVKKAGVKKAAGSVTPAAKKSPKKKRKSKSPKKSPKKSLKKAKRDTRTRAAAAAAKK
ncbi:histone H1-like [Labrus bergylta]|uniref:histone H1-like n=1 Tax=Labrus bergylta TaxID=56723 RepID=UPI0033131630